MEINHVLIVEDDKEIREGVQIYLQSQGYVVFQAADGIEGLEILEKEEIHLAIIDIMMPRMDGIRMTMNPVKLTPIEYKILLLLAKNPGRVFSAEEIYERVWQEKAINTDTIMVHVRNIREKIEIDPKNPKYLKVVWGVGYKIEKQP